MDSKKIRFPKGTPAVESQGAPADGLSQWNTTKEILATISDD